MHLLLTLLATYCTLRQTLDWYSSAVLFWLVRAYSDCERMSQGYCSALGHRRCAMCSAWLLVSWLVPS